MILKCIWNAKGLEDPEPTFKKNEVRGFILSDSQTYPSHSNQDSITDVRINQINGTEQRPEVDSCLQGPIYSAKIPK